MFMKTGKLGLPLTNITFQFGQLQRKYGIRVPCSPYNKADECGNFFHNFRRRDISSIRGKSQPGVTEHKGKHEFLTSRSFMDGSQRDFTTQCKFESLHREKLTDVLNHRSTGNDIRWSLFCCRAIPKRGFSDVLRATNRIDSVTDGRSQNKPLFKFFRRDRKMLKPLAAHIEKTVDDAPTLTTVDVKNGFHDGQHDGDAKKTVDKNPKTKLKQRQPRKKIIEDNGDETSVADTLNTYESKANVHSALESGFPQCSEKNISGIVPVEVNNSSAARNKSSEMRSSSFQVASGVESYDACINPGTSGLSKKQNLDVKGEKKNKSRRKLKWLYPPTGKSVVVVESLAKAKAIKGYLGDMYEVLPTNGHVRVLAGRSGSVRPDDNFSMIWEVPSAAWTPIQSIKLALSGVENLILASDPDREGEAIAWHLLEILRQQNALGNDIVVSRVVFHEITETSIKAALKAPREIDENLVNAYLARCALDYLICLNMSPLLWRKLPSCTSAGQVEVAALSLLCEREMEIDEFKPQEYWSIEASFKKNGRHCSNNAISFSAQLTHFDSEKLNKFSISSDIVAKDVEEKIHSSNYKVVDSKKSTIRKKPPTPYTTSTLQQDAANKLGFAATYTMKLAQKLYEGIELSDGKAVGLITYNKTDGLHISNEAVKDIHSLISERYGANFACEGARNFFKKVKNDQEAHEAIRPTDIRRLPDMIVGLIDGDSSKLYALIWSRTMACQMIATTIDQIQLDIGCIGDDISFRSTCSRVGCLGYQAAYRDVEEEAVKNLESERHGQEEIYNTLSSFQLGDELSVGKVELKQQHTKPPPRYSEGTMIKRLEQLGIGRPSTYASTLLVLQDRKYVAAKRKLLHPEFRGRILSAFIANHFSKVIDYNFTAGMEMELDNVSAGMTEWKGLLKDYWTRFSSYCARAGNLQVQEVEKMLEKTLGDFLFASLPDESKSRTCPSCKVGTLVFKVSTTGAGYFIGCDQHRKCKYIVKTLYTDEEDEDIPQNNKNVEEPKLLGMNPNSCEKVLLKVGPFGMYVQLGEDRKGYLPKRAPVTQKRNMDPVTLEDALELLRYPVTLGAHSDDGKPVIIKIAKGGFIITHGPDIVDVPQKMKANELTLEGAMKLLSSKNVKRSRIGRPKNKPRGELYEVH